MGSNLNRRLSAEEWGKIYNKTRKNDVEDRVGDGKKDISCWSREMFHLTKEGDEVLEIGAGSGETSVYLANRKRNITAIDFSKEALELIDEVSKGKVKTVFADASKPLPLEETQYDVIFQAGLLEHFSFEEQCAMLELWKRYLKEDGIMISLVPNAASVAYRIGKAHAEKKGTWEYGLETPLYSFQSQFHKAGYEVKEEYTIGAEHALKFLPKFSFTKYILRYWLNHNECGDLCGQGYLLVTVGTKN